MPMPTSQRPESIDESLFDSLQEPQESKVLGGHDASDSIRDDPETTHIIGRDSEGNYVCQDHD